MGAFALVGSLTVGQAAAQGSAPEQTAAQETAAVQGPLASPDAVSQLPPKGHKASAKKAHRHASKPAAAGSPASAPVAAQDGARPAPAADPAGGAPTSKAQRATATDPMDFSFKWRGNNDSAEATRVQNYNGDAAGTGAALGLNLHF